MLGRASITGAGRGPSYFVRADGSDAATGTSEATAWQTLAKINSTSIPAGATINLRRGDVFQETLDLSGKSLPLKLRGFGTGNSPVITGANTLGSWTQQSASGPAAISTNTFETGAWTGGWSSAGTDSTAQAYAGTHSRLFTAESPSAQSGAPGKTYAFIRFRYYVSSTSTATTQQTNIIQVDGQSYNGGTGLRLWLSKNAGAFWIGMSQSTTANRTVQLAANTWHDIAFEFSSTVPSMKLWVNQNPQTDTPVQTLTPTVGGPMSALRHGQSGWNPETFVTYHDEHVYYDANPYNVTQPINWYATLAAAPFALWLDDVRRLPSPTLAGLASDGEWFYDDPADRVYIRNSAGSPATTWSKIEAGLRPAPIQMGSLDAGLTVEDVTVARQDLIHPFASASAWNTTTAGMTFSAVPAVADQIMGLSSWNTADDLSIEVYYAKDTDPLCDVLYVDSWLNVYNGTWKRSANTTQVEANILAASATTFPKPYNNYSSIDAAQYVLPAGITPLVNPSSPPFQVRLPAGAIPIPQTDGHFVVVQPDGKIFEAYAGIRLSTGQIVCETYTISHPWRQGDYRMGGKSAPLLPLYAGLIHDAEYRHGAILHPLKILVPSAVLSVTPPAVYPAGAFDRGALLEENPYAGVSPNGSRFALPPTVDPETIPGVTSNFGKIFARAMRTYGAIITDRGGPGGITIVMERGATHTDLAVFDYGRELELEAIFDRVQVCTPPAWTY